MCGITGGINTLSARLLSEQLNVLAHRGPDDNGVFLHRNVALGHVRLSIQDLSAHGHQPMTSGDGNYVLVYNGELYNHPAIRKELVALGYRFKGHADTETLLYAYIAWGKDCLQKLNGIFAFAIYDLKAGKLFIARDPIGVKPLYYYQKGNQFLFASELKALLHLPEIDYSVQPKIFHNYITLLWSPGTETPFRHFKKLLPGHYIEVSTEAPGGAAPVRYYNIPFTGTYSNLSKNQWVQKLEEQLHKSLAQQQLSDVPIGYFLSGGIDSTLLAALAAKENRQLETFTIDTGSTMQKEGFDDDLPYALLAAKELGIATNIIASSPDILTDLDQMVWHLDEPQADPAAIHVYNIARAAADKGIKVLISGAGADELFSGYRRHQSLLLQKVLGKMPLITGNTKYPLLRRLNKLAAIPGFQNPFISSYYWLNPYDAAQLFMPDIQKEIDTHWFEAYTAMLDTQIPAEKNQLNKMLHWDMNSFLPDHNLNYTDKMGMATGVEIRVPYLDKELVALAATIPPSLKMKGLTTKYLLREVAQKHLPEAIIKRKKTGFAAPVRQWMRYDKKEWVREQLLDNQFYQSGYFNRQMVEELILKNEAGKTDGSYALLSLLCIASWMHQFA